MKVANTAGALNDTFYPEAVGTLTDASTDPNALPGVSLGVDDLGYIKQGKPANRCGGGFEPTQAQLDAMNSGITSTDVEQINTNKNNILFLNATAEITGWHKADATNKLAFNYAFSYDGTENVEYGFLFYRNGILNLDMTFVAKNMISGIGSTKTSPTGTLETSDNGSGVYLRPYIKIGARYKYGEQVFTKYANAPNQ